MPLPTPCPLHMAALLPPRLALQSVAQRQAPKRSSTVVRAASTEAVLPPALEKLVNIFKMVPDSKLKYQQLLQYAKQLPPLPADMHTEEHKVRGCVSQVWMVPTLRGDGTIYWAADSDSALTKGLAALLVQGLSGASPEQIARLDPTWVSDLSPQLSLTPSRTNGFLNMFRTMQSKSLAMLVAQGRGAGSDPAAHPPPPPPQPDSASAQPLTSQTDYPVTSSTSRSFSPTSTPAGPAAAPDHRASTSGAGTGPGAPHPSSWRLRAACLPSASASSPAYPAGRRQAAAAAAASSASAPSTSAPEQGGPIQQAMRSKLQDALQPSQLMIEDESSQHAGHAGVAGRAGGSGESHFKIHLTCAAFEGLNTLKRHRLVYQALKEEMAGPVHAMSLVCRAPGETA